MADEVRMNRPQQPMGGQSPMMRPEYQGQGDMQPSGGSKMPWVVLGVIVVVIIILAVLFRGKLFGAKSGTMTTTTGSSGYQAVFLTNGQVYFGKLTDADTDYPMLTDIYYLQVVQPPLQGSNQTGAAAGQPAPAAQPQISLVKLGNELHGPVDEMHIAKAQILFYEDMKPDSQVVKAIETYKATPTK